MSFSENLNHKYKYYGRYKTIIGTFLKYGIDQSFDSLTLKKYFKVSHKKKVDEYNHRQISVWEKIRKSLEELGPTFIKFGQLLSNRSDLLPQNLVNELYKLQDEVPPFYGDRAIEIVEQELDCRLDDIFIKFSKDPSNSASIAQVHKAILKNGQIVAVKVQRPDIEEIIDQDIEIMEHIIQILEKHIEFIKDIQLSDIVQEFKKSIKKELDFTIESLNSQRFSKMFNGEKNIYVQKVFDQFSTKKILILEYIDGVKINKANKQNIANYDAKIIARNGTNLVLKQIFEHGFFHADPHPGNIFVLNNNVISFLDFGLMGSLNENEQESLGAIIMAASTGESKRVAEEFIQISQTKHTKDIDLLRDKLILLIEKYTDKPLKDIKLKYLMNETTSIFVKHKLRLPSNFILLIKSLMLIESLGVQLDPDYNIMEQVRPYSKKIFFNRIGLKHFLSDFMLCISDLKIFLRDLPSDLKKIIKNIKSGKIKVSIEHKGLIEMVQTYDSIANRVVFAIVLASLLISSSLLVLSGIPPTWYEIPIIGLIGYLVSGIIAFTLIINMIRHGKMK